MKQNLAILAVLVAAATWGCGVAVAFNNPNVLSVDVAIDGVSEANEENPGGYAVVGGARKKVTFSGTLDPSAPNPKVRVSWVTGKMELQEATGAAVTPDFTLVAGTKTNAYKDYTVSTPFTFDMYVTGLVASATSMDEAVAIDALHNTPMGDTGRVTVVSVESINATSPKSGTSANPPPFPGHRPWPFDVTHSPNPDKHMVVFYKDVVDSSFNVLDFDVTLTAKILPTCITANELNEVWSKISGPASGSLNRTDTFEVKYQNPKLGGVYRFDFDLGLSGCAKSEANVVLPLAGAEVDSIVKADVGRANTFATNVLARYSWLQRQRRANGRRWFIDNGAGDYLGRPDSASTPTVWVYNQVNNTSGMGAVGTWKGKPVRVAKISNFMVGYAARKIGVNSVSAWVSQVIGTWNDSAASKSWDAGWDIAGGASYDTKVAALVADIWDEADNKNQKLWPNTSATDNYVVPNSFNDPDHQFTSPGFLYMISP